MTITDLKRLTEDEARQLIEGAVWPHGPVCPHCGNADHARIGKVKANPKKRVRAGLYQCKECSPRRQFTVTKGTFLESTHLPMRTWVYIIAAMCNSKTGVASRQLQRDLKEMKEDGSYGNFQSIWYACHRVRHAMSTTELDGLLGGEGKTLEADETFMGPRTTKPRQPRSVGKKDKIPVVTLIERSGGARSTVANDITAFTLRNHLVKHGNPASRLMTDEHAGYKWPGKLFKSHESVNHSKREYARGEVTSNEVESFFSLVKKSAYAVHFHYSRQHMGLYLSERDYTWTTRKMSDVERVKLVFKKGVGKRLLYKTSTATTLTKEGRRP
ncbi:MAG: IS1595 family transposase [Flavobacteriales bacterium]